MKNILMFCCALCFLGASSSSFAQSKNLDEFLVQVDGLGCSFCAFGLEKSFKELKGIKKIKIDLEKGLLSFVYPAEKMLGISQIEKQVDDAGYTPVSVEIKRADGRVESSPKVEAEELVEALQSYTLFVAGNCGMCKARIESAAKSIEGVQEAVWEMKSQELTVKLEGEVSPELLAETIAKAGHDTKTTQAPESVYQALPGCCQYNR